MEDLLISLLGCAAADVKFLVKELEAFEVSASEAVEHMSNSGNDTNFNILIESIYEVALAESGLNPDDYTVKITPNYLASTFTIDGEIINDLDDFIRISDYMKEEVILSNFTELHLPLIVDRYEKDGIPDQPARREEFNNMLDAMCKEERISEKTLNNYCIPDELETMNLAAAEKKYLI